MIDEKVLISAGASIKIYNPGEEIFREGDYLLYYYQIIKGEVKLNNYKEDGKEFIQNILTTGQSFGESLLFLNRPCPMNAIALKESSVFLLPKNKFLTTLETSRETNFQIIESIAERLYFEFIMLKNNSSTNPIVRLKGLMDYLKSFQKDKTPFSFQIPFTRQQMANLTGISVETAIRAIKTMEKKRFLKIKDRKVYY